MRVGRVFFPPAEKDVEASGEGEKEGAACSEEKPSPPNADLSSEWELV